ncbi:hypothetical protein B0H19DRAFT_1059495 [Mycena capillaripes]|nr:hypothetical protein B0H19DRAFT_1059495 [Mycena capillaripes]
MLGCGEEFDQTRTTAKTRRKFVLRTWLLQEILTDRWTKHLASSSFKLSPGIFPDIPQKLDRTSQVTKASAGESSLCSAPPRQTALQHHLSMSESKSTKSGSENIQQSNAPSGQADSKPASGKADSKPASGWSPPKYTTTSSDDSDGRGPNNYGSSGKPAVKTRGEARERMEEKRERLFSRYFEANVESYFRAELRDRQKRYDDSSMKKVGCQQIQTISYIHMNAASKEVRNVSLKAVLHQNRAVANTYTV